MEKDAEQVRREAEAGQTGEKVAAPDPAVATPATSEAPAVSAGEPVKAETEPKPQSAIKAPSEAKPQAKAPPSKEQVLNMTSRERAAQGGPIEVAAVLVLVVVGIIGVLVILFGGG